jgi:hypothetical protein
MTTQGGLGANANFDNYWTNLEAKDNDELTLANKLKHLERNVYSQNGEDGIVDWVFSRIGPRYRICVEFGAWDGRNLSNTFNLVAHHGWKAIYIEADPQKFKALNETASAYPGITPIFSLVADAGENTLDQILERRDIPQDFDILSIDVDGNDYDIWENTKQFQPSLVIIEHNQTFPATLEFIDRGGRAYTGSSAAALNKLASRKGYALLGCTLTNSFFLREPLFALLDVKPQTVHEAFDRRDECYVIVNHAGEIVFSNRAITKKLASVIYAQPIKALVRWALRMPTYYILGDARKKDGAILKLLRLLQSSVR